MTCTAEVTIPPLTEADAEVLANVLFMEVESGIIHKHSSRYTAAYNAEINDFVDSVQACEAVSDRVLVAIAWLIKLSHEGSAPE